MANAAERTKGLKGLRMTLEVNHEQEQQKEELAVLRNRKVMRRNDKKETKKKTDTNKNDLKMDPYSVR